MKPRIFIGSSVEGKGPAEALQIAFKHDARATVWHQAFGLGGMTIDTLLERFGNSDFAVFIFSPDDMARMRESDHLVARDNVVFEAGMFMGMHGRDRTFIVVPQGVDRIHIPTDLLGYTTATYDTAWARDEPKSAMGATASEVLQAIATSSWTKQNIRAKTQVTYDAKAFWPLKLWLSISNETGSRVRVRSRKFAFDKKFAHATNRSPLSGDHKPAFKVGVDNNQKDIWSEECWIDPRQTVSAFIAFDPDKLGDPQTTMKELTAAAATHKVGVWSYRCLWDDDRPVTRDYELAV